MSRKLALVPEHKRPRNLDPFMTVRQAAEYCNRSYDFIYDRVRRQEIDSQPMGKNHMIRLSSLEAWMEQEKERVHRPKTRRAI